MSDTLESLGLCAVIALAVTGVITLLRRKLNCNLDERSATAVGGVVAFVASLFAFVLGLTIVNLWSRYNDADDLADREANRVGMMYDLVSDLPSAAKLRHSLGVYAKSVAEEEWPMMAQGKMRAETEQLKTAVLADVFVLVRKEPDTAVIAQSLVDHAITMSQDRHEREDLLSSSLHPLVLEALGASGLFTLVGFLFISITNRRVQFLIDFIMAGTIALNFYLLLALDFPLNGSGFSVSNEAFLKVSARIAAAEAAMPSSKN